VAARRRDLMFPWGSPYLREKLWGSSRVILMGLLLVAFLTQQCYRPQSPVAEQHILRISDITIVREPCEKVRCIDPQEQDAAYDNSTPLLVVEPARPIRLASELLETTASKLMYLVIGNP